MFNDYSILVAIYGVLYLVGLVYYKVYPLIKDIPPTQLNYQKFVIKAPFPICSFICNFTLCSYVFLYN